MANESEAASGSSLTALLAQIEAEPPGVQGVRRLEEALAGNAPTPSDAEGDSLLSRGARYLDAARPGAANDPALAVGLVKSYQRLGELYEPIHSQRALAFYETAARVALEAAGGITTQGVFGAQCDLLAQRIERLGGTVPGKQLAQESPSQDLSGQGASGQGAPGQPVPNQTPPEPVLSQQELISTKDRLISVKAKCMSAEDAYRQIEQSTRRAGYAPNSDITTAYRRMQIALQTAESELEAGKIAKARESFNLADASANRVLEAAGAR